MIQERGILTKVVRERIFGQGYRYNTGVTKLIPDLEEGALVLEGRSLPVFM